jgi:hypothetical protein
MAARKKPSTVAQAKAAKSPIFYGKGNKELAAVTKEELKKSGLSLRDYLNKRKGKTRRTAAKVAPRPKPAPAPAPKARPSKRPTDTGQRLDNRPVKFTPKPKSRPTGSSAPLNTKGSIVPTRS